jgi:hypothetical protein
MDVVSAGQTYDLRSQKGLRTANLTALRTKCCVRLVVWGKALTDARYDFWWWSLAWCKGHGRDGEG